jgi:hypothetical protein
MLYAGVGIGRDVGRIQRAERGRHRPVAGKDSGARDGVAGDAVAGLGQVLAALDLRGLRRAGRLGVGRQVQGGGQRQQGREPARQPSGEGRDHVANPPR